MPALAADPPFNLKYRLTGAVILVAAASLVVYLLLQPPRGDRSGTPAPQSDAVEEDPFVSRIVGTDGSAEPPPPEAAGSAADAPPENGPQPVLEPDMRLPVLPRLNTVNPAAEAPQETPSATIRQTPPPERSAATGGWVVRVASFADQANADKALERLRAAGYQTGSARVQVAGRNMVRVWAGPFADRRDAVRAKAEISGKVGLEGFVRRQQ